MNECRKHFAHFFVTGKTIIQGKLMIEVENSGDFNVEVQL